MKHQYKITNWPEYNKSLISRGDIFLYFTPDYLRHWHNTQGRPKLGRPLVYSNAAIEVCLLIRELFRFPLRQTQGFVTGLIRQLKLRVECPHYSLLCRRAKKLAKKLKRFSQVRSNEPIHVLVDASGLKVFGEGEWKVRTHGKDKRRTWKKVHIAVDRERRTIVSTEITDGNCADVTQLQALLDPLAALKSVAGDGAYDSKDERRYINKRGADALIPPDENAVVSKSQPEERNEAVRFIQAHGDDEAARKLWKERVGYHQRSLVENSFFRSKTIFGEHLRSRKPENQKTEWLLRCQLLNKMTQMGMPVSYRCPT
jgi:hypothetical protein